MLIEKHVFLFWTNLLGIYLLLRIIIISTSPYYYSPYSIRLPKVYDNPIELLLLNQMLF